MSVDFLLAHLPELSEAPHAIDWLRRYVVELAVRGELVEQRAGERPVDCSEWETVIDGSHLPPGWCRSRFGSVFELQYGKNLPAERRTGTGEYPVYGSNGVVGSHNEYCVEGACIVVGRKGSAGALNLCADPRCWVTDVAYYLVPPEQLDLRYTFLLLGTMSLDEFGKGIKPGLSRADVRDLPVEIPPFAEQARILARVEALMEVLDELEDALIEREARRCAFVESSLRQLELYTAGTDGQPSCTDDSAALVLANWARSTARPRDVSRIAATLKTLAVQGRLGVLDPTTCQSAITDLQRAGIPYWTDAHVGGALDDAPPWPAPKGWAWARLGDLCSKTGSGSTPRGGKAAYVEDGVPFLRSQNVYDEGLMLDDVAYITEEMHQRMAGTALRPGDLLLNITGGSIGRCTLLPDDFARGNVSQHVAIVRPRLNRMRHYMHRVLCSPYFQAEVVRRQTGAGRGGLPKRHMDKIWIPVPPAPEQDRIVQRLNHGLELCDDLTENLACHAAIGSRLLHSLLPRRHSAAETPPTGRRAPCV